MNGLAELVPATAWLTGAVLTAAAFAGGLLNTGAVGGSLISFLALTWLAGLDPLTANGTNIVLIAFAFLPALATPRAREIVRTLRGRPGPDGLGDHAESAVLWNMITGKVIGVVVLLFVSVAAFTTVTPWLLAVASVLLAASPWLRALVARRQSTGRHQAGRHRAAPPTAYLAVGAVGLYAGFFAGATGALLFAALALVTDWPVHRINEVKNLVGTVTTLVGAVPLAVLAGTATVVPVAWGWVAVLAVPTALGGWAGLAVSAWLPRRVLLVVVVTTSAAGAVLLAIQS